MTREEAKVIACALDWCDFREEPYKLAKYRYWKVRNALRIAHFARTAKNRAYSKDLTRAESLVIYEVTRYITHGALGVRLQKECEYLKREVEESR
jgi:hypothetical protein